MTNRGSDEILTIFAGLSEKKARELAEKMVMFGLSERQKGDDMEQEVEQGAPQPTLAEIRQDAASLADEAAVELRKIYKTPMPQRDLRRQVRLEHQLEEGMSIASDVDKSFAAAEVANAQAQADAEAAQNAPLVEELRRLYKTPVESKKRITEIESILGWRSK